MRQKFRDDSLDTRMLERAEAAYREALASAQGWPYMLQRYRDAAARRANLPVQADGR